MKKPKIFDEWFDIVYEISEQGEYVAYEIWSEEECDECYEFLKKLMKVENLDEQYIEEKE